MENIENTPKYLDVYPYSRGKRILLFLADFFVTFIISIFIFSFVTFLIAKHASDYDNRSTKIGENEYRQVEILYNNNILYSDVELKKLEISTALTYTGKQMISYFVNSTATNVFDNFYVKVANKSVNDVAEMIKSRDTSNLFFSSEKDINGYYKMKPEIIDEFKPAFDPQDQMSAQGQKDYNSFLKNLFLPMYTVMLQEIRTTNIVPSTSPLAEIKTLYKENVDTQNFLDNVVQISALVSYFVGVTFLFLVIPLFSKRNKTIGCMALRVCTVSKDSFHILKKSEVVLRYFYALLLNLPAIIFLPIAYIKFSYIFSYGYLLYPSLIMLGYLIISMFVTFFSNYNQTLTDMMTRTITIEDSMLDKVVKLNKNIRDSLKKKELEENEHKTGRSVKYDN